MTLYIFSEIDDSLLQNVIKIRKREIMSYCELTFITCKPDSLDSIHSYTSILTIYFSISAAVILAEFCLAEMEPVVRLRPMTGPGTGNHKLGQELGTVYGMDIKGTCHFPSRSE